MSDQRQLRCASDAGVQGAVCHRDYGYCVASPSRAVKWDGRSMCDSETNGIGRVERPMRVRRHERISVSVSSVNGAGRD